MSYLEFADKICGLTFYTPSSVIEASEIEHPFNVEKLEKPLEDAIIIGHVTTTSAKIWVRAKKPGKHYILLSANPFEPETVEVDDVDTLQAVSLQCDCLQSRTITLSYDSDNTACETFDQLAVGQRYYVALVADKSVNCRKTWRSGHHIQPSFTTQSEGKDSLSFGMFSCHDPFKSGAGSSSIFTDMKQAMEELDCELLICAGDQVYVDESCEKDNIWRWVKANKGQLEQYYPNQKQALIAELVHFYRYIYRKYWGNEALLTLWRRFPTYMMWDDHEIMDGWGSYSDKELSNTLDTWFEWENPKLNLFIAFAMFEAAKQVYGEYQHCHNPDTKIIAGKQQRDYEFDRQHVGFYALDQRGDHKYQKDGSSNLLGLAQFNRFRAYITQAAQHKKAIFVVLPVPVIHWSATLVNAADIASLRDDFRDEWDHESNHKERGKLLKLVHDVSHKYNIPIIFLSGDVHCAACFKITQTGSLGRVYQFTASGVTRAVVPIEFELLVAKRGDVGVGQEGKVMRYERLSFLTRNNFATLKVEFNGQKTKVTGVHVSVSDQNEWQMKRVDLS